MLIAALLASVTGFVLDAAPEGRDKPSERPATANAHQEAPGHGPAPAPRNAGHEAYGPRHAPHRVPRHAPPLPQHARPAWSAGAPEATWSRYMTTVDQLRMRRLGCDLGQRVRGGHEPDDSLVVLAFGMPMHHKGRFGASLFGHFANSRKIGGAAVAFGRGFGECLGESPGHLTLSIGTSNYGRDVTYRHGRIWGSMVNRANGILRSWGLADTVSVHGGNDIEPGWRGPKATRRWIRGYKSVTSTPYFNFGGAGGCPPAGYCEGDWTIEDIWYAAWGSGVAIPLPEIYSPTGTNAEQWYRLSLWSYKTHGERMDIAGAMSQRQSCWDTHDRCFGIRNPPNRSWSQLWHALNKDPRTAQPLRFSTNISWRN